MLKRLSKIFGILFVLLVVSWIGLKAVEIHADTPEVVTVPNTLYGSGEFFFPPYLSDSDRMGFGKASSHDASVLKAGWYLDWAAATTPAHPGGAVYAYSIKLAIDTGGQRVCQAEFPNSNGYQAPATQLSQIRPSLTGTVLIQKVQASPGSLWLIGNEPDSVYQGDPIQAELYAELYHYFYTTIKAADPTAKVAIGAVVQPSPLRMAYLDRVLARYNTLYGGQSMPIDVWNIHFYNFPEVKCAAGAGVPPGFDQNGWNFGWGKENILNLAKMETDIRSFRSWMKTKGYRNTPLIITEFGSLFPYGQPTESQFLKDIFERFLVLTDSNTGYQQDGNRLIQMWAWFATYYEHNFGGYLFQADSNTLTLNGYAFIDKVNAHYTAYTDLQTTLPITSVSTSEVNFSGYVQNWGNTNAEDVNVKLSLVNLNTGYVVSDTVSLGEMKSRYASPPILITQTWRLANNITPAATVPFSMHVTIVSPDSYQTNNTLSYQLNWYSFADLIVSDFKIASKPVFLYENPLSLLVTATVKNVGLLPVSGPGVTFFLKKPDHTVVQLAEFGASSDFRPGDTAIFTTTVPITQSGIFEVSAVAKSMGSEVELTSNNSQVISLMAAKGVAFLPLIAR